MKILYTFWLLVLMQLTLLAQGPSRIAVMANTNGTLLTPTNFFISNLVAGANVGLVSGAGGKVTISAVATNVVSTNLDGIIVTNLIQGTNTIFYTATNVPGGIMTWDWFTNLTGGFYAENYVVHGNTNDGRFGAALILTAGTNAVLYTNSGRLYIAGQPGGGGTANAISNMAGLGTNLTVHPANAVAIPLTIHGAAGQVFNLFQIEDSSSSPLFTVQASGAIAGNGASLTNIPGTGIQSATITSNQIAVRTITTNVMSKEAYELFITGNAVTNQWATNTPNKLYVSPTGSDYWPGTMLFPLATLSNACRVVPNNTTIECLPGSNWVAQVAHASDGLVTVPWLLTNKNHIYIHATGSDHYWATQITAMVIKDCSNIVVDGLGVINQRQTANPPEWMTNWVAVTKGIWAAIGIADSSDIQILNCRFEGLWDHAIIPNVPNISTVSVTNGIVVRGCVFRNLGWRWGSWPDGAGVVPGTEWLVEGNLFLDTGRGVEAYQEPSAVYGKRPANIIGNVFVNVLSEAIIAERMAVNAVGNLIINNTTDDPAQGVGIWLRYSQGSLISGNTIIGKNYGIKSETSTNCDIVANKIEGGLSAMHFDVGEDMRVHDNKCIGATTYGLFLQGAIRDFEAVDNSWRNCGTNDGGGNGGALLANSVTASNLVFRNNRLRNDLPTTYGLKFLTPVSVADLRLTDNDIAGNVTTGEHDAPAGALTEYRNLVRAGFGTDVFVATNLWIGRADGSPMPLMLGSIANATGLGLWPDDLNAGAFDTLTLYDVYGDSAPNLRNLRAGNGYFAGSLYATSSVVSAGIYYGDGSGLSNIVAGAAGITNAIAAVDINGTNLVSSGATNINLIAGTGMAIRGTNSPSGKANVYFESTGGGGDVYAASNNVFTGSNTFQTVSIPGFRLSATNNTAVGSNALAGVTTGFDNTAAGTRSLASLTVGMNNTAVGVESLYSLTTGSNNTALGWQALFECEDGTLNTALGKYALTDLTNGIGNTAVGYAASVRQRTNGYNTAIGFQSLHQNQVGDYNVGIGYNALYNMDRINPGTPEATYNVAIGSGAGDAITSGYYNTFIGPMAGSGAQKPNSVLSVAIGFGATNSADNQITFGRSGGTEIVWIPGKTAIGTNSPQAQLHVVGNGSAANLFSFGTIVRDGQITGTTNGALSAHYVNVDTNLHILPGPFGVNHWYVYSVGSGLWFSNSGQNVIVLDNNGAWQNVASSNYGWNYFYTGTMVTNAMAAITNANTMWLPGHLTVNSNLTVGGTQTVANLVVTSATVGSISNVAQMHGTNFYVEKNIGFTINSHVANPEGTNITLQATAADSYIGTSNVNIVAVMGGTAGLALNKTIVITNGTGVTWGISFSAVTNQWKWSYTQAAPTVLTNGTQLMISARIDGTNVLAGYAYYSWP